MKWTIDDKGSSLYTTKYFINYGILKNIQNLLFGVLIIWGLDYRLFLFSPLEFFFVISEFYSFVTKFEKKKKLLKLKNENESSLNYKLELSTEHSWFFDTNTKSFLSFHRHSYHYPAFFPNWNDTVERPFLHQALSHRKVESQSEHLQIRKLSCGAGLAKDFKLVSFADQLLYLEKETVIHIIILFVPQPLWWGRDFEQMFFIFLFYLIFLGLDFTIFITVTGPIDFKNPAGKLLQYLAIKLNF